MPTGSDTGRTRSAGEAVATRLRFEDDRLIVVLDDGREMSLPLSLYPTLLHATSTQRDAWELIGPDTGFHWEELDLDLSVQGLLLGLPEAIPAPPSPSAGEDITPPTTDRKSMTAWVLEALNELGGAAPILEVNKAIWRRHAKEIEASEELFYRWQYEIRWAADLLRKSGDIISDSRGWALTSTPKRTA
jgi:hypothetical protein